MVAATTILVIFAVGSVWFLLFAFTYAFIYTCCYYDQNQDEKNLLITYFD